MRRREKSSSKGSNPEISTREQTRDGSQREPQQEYEYEEKAIAKWRPNPAARKSTKEVPLTRALRSHQLWLTITYLGLLALMGRGLAG
jgi:hypothetical protein